jgi:hypothetical protein
VSGFSRTVTDVADGALANEPLALVHANLINLCELFR